MDTAAEKRLLIYELWVLAKNGIQISKNYTMSDDVDEMRNELQTAKEILLTRGSLSSES
jgi:hypothetical protein